LQKIYDDYKSKGLEIVSVNQGDPRETVENFIREKKWSFPIVLDSGQVSMDYKVTSVPTNILVNAKGQIVYRAVGFDEAELKTALRNAGIQ
jgi:hypothetical protein